DQQDTLGDRAAQPGILFRVAQEVHDLDELVLGLVDARNVVEGDPSFLLIVAAGAAAADAHEPSAESATLLGGAAVDPDIEANQQQRRPEAEEEGPERVAALLDRLRADLDSMLDQQSFESGVDEGRQRGRERRHFLRRAWRPLWPNRIFSGDTSVVIARWVHDRLDKAADDCLAAAEDRLDLVALHLGAEERVGHLDR